MILSNQCIRRAIYDRSIGIEPFDDRRVQPSSYDLTLGDEFITADKKVQKRARFALWDRQFVLGTTAERLTLGPGIMGIVAGVSTLGRMGLIVEMAGVIDPGFDGQITLELYNAGIEAIFLEPGMRIAQVVFYRTCCPAHPPYDGRYQHQTGAVGPLPESPRQG